MKNILLTGFFLVGLALCGPAAANWNSDWAAREKITLNTGDDGVAIKSAVEGEQVLVRLHTGNFTFTDAKPDGSDLRFIADDDKTPLKFAIERYDSVTELALIWVTVPKLVPGNKTGYIWLYYNNPKAVPASDPKTTFDAAQTVDLHFDEKDALPKDATAYANNVSESTATPTTSGLIGAGASFNGSAHMVIPASASLAATSNGISVSMWIKPDGAAQNAVLFKQSDAAGHAISMTLQGDKLVVQANSSASAPGGAITVGAWHHVALVGKETLTAYVDGQPVGEVAAPVPAIAGPVEIGAGYKGDMDEVRVASTARSADWIKVEASGQGADQHLLTYAAADAGEESGPNYFKILLGSVTVDGWVVIGILMVMMVISFSVMVLKGIFIGRSTKANAEFKDRFATLGADLTLLEKEAALSISHRAGRDPQSMRQIYHVGIIELRKRMKTYAEKGRPLVLTAQSIDAIRASLDATLIRELQGLNAQMVLLTIAIAGGPFLGLLGTVVGVMITFAAIAAAGDVNVNAIAPGIAAALVATVAGLGVAIPSLFGYNYLASKIKELSTDMQVFVDEFVTRLAESYSE
jgi:biopolymer transport protein ExbB